MYPKPKGFTWVGFIQCFLALFFVLWFFIKPEWGIYFAWPVRPELTAVFLGCGFLLRSFYGFHLWREKYWYKLRWIRQGDYAFLGVLFVTTWWHIYEMNWSLPGVERYAPLSLFCLLMAHVWMFAYTYEPITVYLNDPRGADKEAADAPVPESLSEGAIQPFTKTTLLVLFYGGWLIFGLLFFDTTFANFRWPWDLNAFDSRIMSAFAAGVAVWGVSMYHLKDWAEIKVGFTGVCLFLPALFVMSITTMISHPEWWVAGRKNALTFVLAAGIVTAMLLYSYWQQERAKPKTA